MTKIEKLVKHLMDSQNPYFHGIFPSVYKNQEFEFILKDGVWKYRQVGDAHWFLFLSTEFTSILDKHFIDIFAVEKQLLLVTNVELIYYILRIEQAEEFFGKGLITKLQAKAKKMKDEMEGVFKNPKKPSLSIVTVDETTEI